MLGRLILKGLSVYLERKTYAPRVTAPSVQINTGALPLGAQESWRKVLTQSKNKAERESPRRRGNAWDNLNRWEVGPSRCSCSGESIVLCVGLWGGCSYLELEERKGVFHPVTALRSDWKVMQKPDFTLLCGLLEHERYWLWRRL